MSEKLKFQNLSNFCYLHPGKVAQEHFELLICISNIRSSKIIKSLNDFLVVGVPRKIIFETYGVSASYFSVCLKKLRNISACVEKMYQSYFMLGARF